MDEDVSRSGKLQYPGAIVGVESVKKAYKPLLAVGRNCEA